MDKSLEPKVIYELDRKIQDCNKKAVYIFSWLLMSLEHLIALENIMGNLVVYRIILL
ncbi:MAG: hypothetical protein ACI4SR_09565 [Faecalibacillus sp.]